MIFGGVIHWNKKSICILGFLMLILFIYLNGNDTSEQLKSRKISLSKLLNVAIKAAENGGKEVITVKDVIKITSKGLTKEGQVDSVTTADFLSHCSMLKTLKYFFPFITVISEEAKTKCKNQVIDYRLYSSVTKNLADEYVEEGDVTIWIDPLDATQEYTEKLYNYVTTMVCVAVKGKALLGIIHKPFNATTSWGWVHKATSKDLIVDRNNKEKSDGTLKIIVSRSHSGKIEEVLRKNLSKQFQLISAAGAGFKTLEVATKKVDAYLHITAIKKWDICAGNAIINSLGGRMTTKYNKEIDYTSDNQIINDNGLIVTMENHDRFIGIL